MTTPRVGFKEHPFRSETWYESYLKILYVNDRLHAGENEIKVDPDYTDANLGDEIADATDRRFFPTIQEAITAHQSNNYLSKKFITLSNSDFAERVFITGTIGVGGKDIPEGGALGSGMCPRILGDGTQNEIVNIAPASGQNACVLFRNVLMDNSYAAQAVGIDKAYLFDLVKPANYGTQPVTLTLINVKARMQTRGQDNQWAYAIRTDGWVDLIIKGETELMALKYAGGNQNGGIRNIVHMRGDDANGKVSNIFVRNPIMHMDWGGGGYPPSMFNIDGGVTGVCSRADFWDPNTLLLIKGIDGTNHITGLGEGELGAHGNLTGIQTSAM